MAINPIEQSIIDRFRVEWISGRVDYQRAAERVEDARRAWQRTSDDSVERLRRAQDDVDHALQRLDELRAVLDEQFDRFCGHMPRATSMTSMTTGEGSNAVVGVRAGSPIEFWMDRLVGLTLVFVSLVIFYAMTLPRLMGPWYYVSILAFIAVLGSLVGMPLLVTGRVRSPR